MVKIVALLVRKPNLTLEEFVRHWHEVHAPLIAALPGIRGYVQSSVLPLPNRKRDWAVDGVAELWFDDVAAVKRAFAGPEAEAMRADEPNFIDTESWVLVSEHTVTAPPHFHGAPEDLA